MPDRSYENYIKNNPNASTLEKAFATYGRRVNLKYPLNDSNKYEARVSFSVVDEDRYRIGLGNSINNIGDLISSGKDFLSGAISGLFDGKTEEEKSQALDSFTGYSAKVTGGSQTNFVAASDFGKITLYLPQALNIMDAVSYDSTVSLGRIGAGVEALGGDLNTQKAGQVLGETAREAFGIATSGKLNRDVAAIMAQNRLARAPGGDQLTNAARLSTGLTTNPNTRTMFREVPIRQFTFTFVLIATSSAEADVIEKMIKSFRTEMYPERITAGGIDYGYRFPRRFLIRASYKNKEWDGVKFLPSYLQSFNAVYNPNGMGFHSDGKWTEVQITMTFAESRALAKQDVQKGY